MATDNTMLYYAGAGLFAAYMLTRKKKPVVMRQPVAPPVDEEPEGAWGPPDELEESEFVATPGTLDACLQGWSDAELHSLMTDRLVEAPWTGQTTKARVFQITQSAVAELCPQVFQPETYEASRDATDPAFRAAWDRLTPIAWRVAFTN